jgi:hypothetical protein
MLFEAGKKANFLRILAGTGNRSAEYYLLSIALFGDGEGSYFWSGE